MNNAKRYWGFGAVFCVVVLAMWVLNFLTPLRGDDYYYKFICSGDAFFFDRPIATVYDVFVSQYAHWFGSNGRSIVHFIVQLFDGIFGKEWFNIANAVMFALLAWTIMRLWRARNEPLDLLLCGVLILFLFPSFNETILWQTGSVNYLWASVFVCLFLLAFRHFENRRLKPVHLLLAIPGLFAGWSHEGVAFPLAISLIIYAAINRKTIFGRAALPLVLGFVVGAFICVLSPNILRRGTEGSESAAIFFMTKIVYGLWVCLKLRAFWLLVLSLIIGVLTNRRCWRAWLKEQYLRDMVLSNGVVLSFGVVFAAGVTATRSAIGVELFSLILFLRVVESLGFGHRTLAKSIICICGGILYCAVACYSVPNYRAYRELVTEMETGRSDIVAFHEVATPGRMERYILKALYDSKTDYFDWFFYNDAYRTAISKTYGREFTIIPDMIYEDVKAGSPRLESVSEQGGYPLYVIPLSPDNKDKHPVFVLEPIDLDSLPFWIRPFASRLERYTATEIPATPTRVQTVNIDGRDYIFVGKSLVVDYRLKEIVFK